MKVKVKRKCDGKTGVVKSAFGEYGIGFKYFLVVFDDNSGKCKAPANHFEVTEIVLD